jgi:CBS domain-containing protein
MSIMYVGDILKEKGTSLITIGEEAHLLEAARLMWTRNVGALIVLAPDDHLHGVISEREIIKAIAQWHHSSVLLVQDHMLTAGPIVAPSDSVLVAMHIMTKQRVRHLPVVSDHTVIGLISMGDVVKARLSEKIAENIILQDMAGWPRPQLA